jgi:hypothetical protein
VSGSDGDAVTGDKEEGKRKKEKVKGKELASP